MRGRKPKDLALKMLQGNPGKRSLSHVNAPFSLGVRSGNRGLAVMINLSLSWRSSTNRPDPADHMPAGAEPYTGLCGPPKRGRVTPSAAFASSERASAKRSFSIKLIAPRNTASREDYTAKTHLGSPSSFRLASRRSANPLGGAGGPW